MYKDCTGSTAENKKYICCFSGGKDSMATALLALQHNEPLDQVLFVEVMYDRNTSGEHPEHIAFIKNKCKPFFEKRGVEFKILRSEKTFKDTFFRVLKKSKTPERVGKIYGFPMGGRCAIKRDCKNRPMKRYFRSIDENIQYVGISTDEPARLISLKKSSGNKVSLLEKYGYTNQMAFDLCKQYDLLSPVYKFTSRSGCFFCPNSRDKELRYLYRTQRDLFNDLLRLEQENKNTAIGNIFDTRDGRSLEDFNFIFNEEEKQLLLFA